MSVQGILYVRIEHQAINTLQDGLHASVCRPISGEYGVTNLAILVHITMAYWGVESYLRCVHWIPTKVNISDQK